MILVAFAVKFNNLLVFSVMHPELDIETSKYIIAKVGDKFCELVEQEKEAKSWIGNKDCK